MTDRMTRRDALETLDTAQDVVRRVLKMPGIASDIRSCIAALAEPEALTDHVPDATKVPPDDARGATGWFLIRCINGKRMFTRMNPSHVDGAEDSDEWLSKNPEIIVGYTYSPADALAWVRDGVLPVGQGKEQGR